MHDSLQIDARELVNGSPVPTFIIDCEHRVRHWNRACEQLLGIPAARIVGTCEQWRAFYPECRPVMADLVASGSIDTLIGTYYGHKYRPSHTIPGSYEAEDFFPHLGPDGRWLYFTAAPIRDAAGCLIGAIETLQDITERKRSEEALRREHARLSRVIDHFPGGITLLDEQLRVVLHNAGFRRILGLPDELFATEAPPLADIVDFGARRGDYGPDTPAAQVEAMLAQMRDREPHHFERARADGTVLEVRGTPLPHGGFVTTYTDVTQSKHTERQLKALLDEHRVIFDNAHVGIAYIQDRVVLRCNQRMAEIFGYEGPQALVGCKTSVIYPSERIWSEHGAELYRRLGSQGFFENEVLLKRRNGEPVWCYCFGRPLDPRAPHAGSIWVYSDITQIKRQQEQLELARTVFDNSTEALLISDADNHIVSVNRAYTRITGYGAEEVVGRTPGMFKSGLQDAAFYHAMWQTLLADNRWEGELRDRRKDGEIYSKRLSISVVRDAAGAITNFVAAFSDVTRRKAAEERVHFLAHHDPLTGLPNRVQLRERYARAAEHARHGGGRLAVLFLDLDQFKRVNDSLGHPVGDAMLVAVADRLRQGLYGTDMISRQGGDEFVILLEDVTGSAQIAAVARKILACLEAPFEIDGHVLSSSFSIGVAVSPDNGTDFDTLLQKADTAMYHAKESGRNTFSFFDARMNAQSAERLAVHGRLRRALGGKEFALAFQPQLELASGCIFGAEALLRWTPANAAAVGPDRFIPVAEESGLILPIGEWVIGEAFAQARRWLDAGTPLQVSINVSGRQIYRADLVATLAAAQRATGVPPNLIEIELTESILMEDAATAREVLVALKRAGYSVAIDDFGTGYSSLAYLKRFPLDRLKIDRSFIADLCHNPEDQAIARAVIEIARALNLRVIAEGVETAAQLELLRRHGCHEGQGYFIGRPAPAVALGALLADGPEAPHPVRGIRRIG